MKEIKEKVFQIGLGLFLILFIGTLGYTLIEGWPLFDSLYMTVITVATVGYGETHPLSNTGRLFTIFLIVGGIGMVGYIFSTFTAFIVEGELTDALRRKRMEDKIAKLSSHYILCGAGHTGRSIKEELAKTKRPFVVIESQPEKAEKLKEEGLMVVCGDATDDEVLKKSGIERARGLFATLTSDRDNAFVTLTARGLNPKLRIVAEQVEEGVREKLIRSGANAVINPGFIGGLRMASEMIRPAAVKFLDAMIREGGEIVRIEEIRVPENSPLLGKPIQEIKGSEGNRALLLAVQDPLTKKFDINPRPEKPIQAKERLVVMGTVEHIQELEKQLQ